MIQQQTETSIFNYQIFDATLNQLAKFIQTEERSSGLMSTYRLYHFQIFTENLKPDVFLQHPSTEIFLIARRFSEFEKLHTLLKENYKEIILPSLPTKHAFGMTNKLESDAVEDRINGLEIYLNKILTNQFLFHTQEFQAFFSRVN